MKYKADDLKNLKPDDIEISEAGPRTPVSPKKQPSSKDFWREQKALLGSQSHGTQALTSSPRIVPVSYPTKPRSGGS